MLRYFKRITEYNAETDEEQILDVLIAMAAGKLDDDLTLQNFYRDVPISHKASIRRIEGQQLLIRTQPLQARVMDMEQNTLIRSMNLLYPVVAQVQQLDSRSGIAWLGQLGYASVPSDRRRFPRAYLDAHHAASFSNDKVKIQGTIRDICIGGVAILSTQVEKLPFATRGAVHLDLGSVQATIPATLLRIRDKGEQKKYVFELKRGGPSEMDIVELIRQRQQAILLELEKLGTGTN
jgi:hypothetical protein